MSYTLTQSEFVNLKKRLTMRQNRLTKAKTAWKAKSHDRDLQAAVVAQANQVIAECNYAQNIFDTKGAPDDWARWERAKDDAKTLIRLNTPWNGF
jgi:hypothetical protein